MKESTAPLTPAFDEHAVAIAKRQYFGPGDGDLWGMFRRVAAWVASPEAGEAREAYEGRFYDLMANKRFCPGGRVLAGAATSHGNVLNCFVQDGSPEEAGTDAWVLSLATKLALVTKVGGGNGLCLDPLPPKRAYRGAAGKLYLTISPSHPDYDKVKTGTYLDLVHGKYVTKGYRYAAFVEESDAPMVALKAVEVGDSVESIWGRGGETILKLLRGEDVLLDLSRLRAEGTPVKGSGGESSGPSSFAVEVFDNFALWASLGGAAHAGPVATLRYVFSPTLRVIRQGGTRRGAGMATMSVTNPDIEDFITCKDLKREKEEGDISTFNISVLVTDAFMEENKRGDGVLRSIAEHAWGTGEPGLIFIDRINEYSPMREAMGDIRATNPCVTGDTWVHTQLGPRRVRELVGKPFCAVVDGKTYGVESDGFWSTGVKDVFKLRTKRGFELRLTGNHKLNKVVRERGKRETVWTALEHLTIGDRVALQNHREVRPWGGRGSVIEGWLLGSLVGDGTFAMDKAEPVACLDYWGATRQALAELARDGVNKVCEPGKLWVTNFDSSNKIRLASSGLARLAASYGVVHGHKTLTDEVERASFDFCRGFLRGLFDADGSPQGRQETGVSVRLAGSDLPLLKGVQRMLARLGVLSKVYEERRPAGYRALPDGRGGSQAYLCRADHELVIANDNLAAFQTLVGFEDGAKRARLEAQLNVYQRPPNKEHFTDEIVEIVADGKEEVFDVTVERVHAFDANGISAHNCGEIPLFPGEPCDLGAINLAAYVSTPDRGTEGFDWPAFRADVATCIRFLDNVLEVNKFALEDNRTMSMRLRRLGLGVMGLADALVTMGLAYDSPEGREAVAAMITELRESATAASRVLAEERGAFPDFGKSGLANPRRNVALLTVAPTGTTSMLMGVSSGVEPIFAPFIYRKIGDSYAALIAPLFREMLERFEPHPDWRKDGAWDWDRVVEAVGAAHGSVQSLDFIPEDIKHVLRCAHDIAPEDHVAMQGAVQRAFDEGGEGVANSISKTINMPRSATVEDVYRAYSQAFDEQCKGITVYRDGSREFQVLSTSKEAAKNEAKNDAKNEVKNETSKNAPSRPKTRASQAAPLPDANRLPGEPLFDRPGRLTGFTDNVKLTLPNGDRRSFYITVNKQDELPTEVFINAGKAGDESNADSEALGRVVSIALQYGVPAEAVVKTLRGINGGMYGSYQGRLVASKADLIAVALETAGVENVLNKGAACPDCGSPLRFEEGCQKCGGCGYSKCG